VSDEGENLLGCLVGAVLWVIGLALPTLIGLWLLDLLGIIDVF
jgi:hypothetical protein